MRKKQGKINIKIILFDIFRLLNSQAISICVFKNDWGASIYDNDCPALI
tara:strand:- start:277 stop:423 length:147 start_codon:yes stop_codon:yes gene_type:complete